MSREFYVPCAQYAYPIRSSLPNIGQHLKRFIKLKSQREINNEGSTPDVSVAMSSFRTNGLTEIPHSDGDEHEASGSRLFDNNSQNSQLLFDGLPVVPRPSPSTSVSISEPQTSDFSIESDMTFPIALGQSVGPTSPLMISSGVEARLDAPFDHFNLDNIVNEAGAIIAGDPLAFAAALNAQLGYDRIRTYAELEARRENEPRSVPLLYFQDASNDSFLGSSTSAANGSSPSGSENGSVNGVSEAVQDNVNEESSSSGRRRPDEERVDEARQYYDAARRASLRKQFRHFDDEPPIY